MHQLRFTKQALKVLRKMPTNTAGRIREKLLQLSADPKAPHTNVIKLQNRPGYRLRVGDWRIIYDIDNEHLIILVMKIGSRGGIYR